MWKIVLILTYITVAHAQYEDVHHSLSFQKEHKVETDRTVHNLYSSCRIKYLRDYSSKQNFGESDFMIKNYKPVKTKPIPNKHQKITQHLEVARHNSNHLETPLTEFRKLYHNEKPRRIDTERVIPKSTPLNNPEVKGDQHEYTQPQTDTEKIDIIKTRIENVDEDITTVIESVKPNSGNELKVLKEREIDMCEPSSDRILSIKETPEFRTEPIVEKSLKNTTNLLKVQVENVTEIKNLKITDQNGCMVVLESTIDTNILEATHNSIKIDSPMTVIISPEVKSQSPREIKSETQDVDKLEHASNNFDGSVAIGKNDTSTKLTSENALGPTDISKASVLQEQTVDLIGNDALDAKFDVEATQDRSEVRLSQENINNEVDFANGTEGDPIDYNDDFSADVDNYETRSELSNSPISLPKTPEEDNFWD